ncbi:MAG: M3 family oligoendopeptidase [Chloroflexota bacterium]
MTTATLDKPIEYELSGWDLTELVSDPSPEAVEDRIYALEELVQALVQRRNELDDHITSERVLEMVKQYEQILSEAFTLSAYGSLWFSSDTQSSDALNYRNNMQQRLTEMQNQLLFFDLWWKGLDDDTAASLLPTGSEQADYRYHLEDLRRTKPFTLDEKSEQLINIKDSNGSSALITIYSMLTNRLEFTIEVEGEEKTMTRDQLMGYAFSPDASLRGSAYQELYRVYGHESKVLAQIYSNRVRDWYNEHVKLRNYSSPISVRNIANDVSDASTDALLTVAQQNASVFQRYFKLKAKWLGVDKLRRYDIYAPLASSDRTIPYAEAVNLVLDTFGEFHPQVRAHAERVFKSNHIDSEVRKGKRGGAFCSTVLPTMTPWVLMNYDGRVRDVATLAHELGHAIHSMMAEDHSLLTQHSTLPLAETASVFAEMLLTDRLLDEVKEPLARRELLAASVDDMYGTVMRQAYFVRFEVDAHQAILDNKSTDELNQLYMHNLQEQFGDSLDIAPEYCHEWVSIPHIYNTPFYCYAYSFGQLLVLSLYRRFQEQGESFIPDYLKMLAYGGSARPAHILEEVGINMEDHAFWQGGFDVISSMIDELEAIQL